MDSRNLASSLLEWYRASARDLPWRRTSDPYTIWLSEVMLQQTQVATVIPYFERFLKRFPTPSHVSNAREEEVLATWQGLGYYRRAKLFKQAMEIVSSEEMPTVSEGLSKLPGVGRYSSRAISSIAFGERVACVDGNVERVLSRLFALKLTGERLRSRCEELSQAMMPEFPPGEWNQALMELGAMVCTRTPICEKCPVRKCCVAKAMDSVTKFPLKALAKETRHLSHVCVVPIRGAKLGLRQIPTGEWWAGMWEFPRAQSEPDSHLIALKELGFIRARLLGSHSHTVTNHRIRLTAYFSRERCSSLRWVEPKAMMEIPMPAPQRKVLKMALDEGVVSA